MRTSIATVCLSGSLEEKMYACAAAGFDGIEIFEQDLLVSPMSPEEIRALAHRLGLTLDLFQPFRDFEGVTESLLLGNLRRAEAKFQLMQSLGMDLILLCSNVGTATINDDDLFVEQLRRLAELAEKYQIRIAYEALAWGTFVNTYQHSWEIVRRVDRSNVGLCIDSFHILSRGDDPAQIAEIPGEKIFFVQLADAPDLSLDVLSWSRHHRLFPGQGGFQLDEFLGYLVRSGYAGTISLEIFNDVFRQSNVRRTSADGLRSLIWLQSQTAALLSERETDNLDLQSLPGQREATGFDFAEVRTEDPELVARLLTQLGFRFQGQHRRKPVQLFAAGGARIVINAQRSREIQAQVSGFGVQVPDQGAAQQRASKLLASPVPRLQVDSEQDLPGFRAPDETEVFFRGPHSEWEGEFSGADATADTAPSGRITGIDHINLAQPWRSFDESVLFYTSVLNLHALPGTEVPSPMGLVRSQVLTTSDRSVRLALNIVPQGLEATMERHHEYPAHIAVRTDDIISLARRAVAAGMEFLPIPHNYYADLAARFDLDDGLLAELEELNLLYDRDERGEFLHFYTQTVGTMFLEVVERRNDYDGYGAPNAPVRLAAQFERNRWGTH
ncbi:bifunctional sugar phosphate isomerase/epimerase/4-hydroxyphenylpyruvate dioxygenase family protein [Glutamicibacter sp. X7]